MNNHTASLEITVNVHESALSRKLVFWTSNWKHVIKYDLYVKFPRIFAHNVQIRAKFCCQKFQWCLLSISNTTPLYLGGRFFCGHAVDSKLVLRLQPFSSELKVNFHHSIILQELWMSTHQLTSFHFWNWKPFLNLANRLPICSYMCSSMCAVHCLQLYTVSQKTSHLWFAGLY